MTEHSPTDAIASFQHNDVDTSPHQDIGTSQTGEATADDRHLEMLDAHEKLMRISSQNNAGCSAMMRRGTPGHGT
jgi:hypothetical protein